MSKKYEHIEILDNGIVHYDNNVYQMTPNEIKKANKEYYDFEYSFIDEIIADGFIEFPVLFDLGNEPIWNKCYLPPEFLPSCTENFQNIVNGVKYNIYIPSYERAGETKTDKLLEKYGIENYYLCIDPSQYPKYKKHYDRKHLIIRDPFFKNKIQLDLESSVMTGDCSHGTSGIYNSLLFMSKSLGEQCYMTMDDDIFGLGMKGAKFEGADNTKYDKKNFYSCPNLRPDLFDLKEYLNDMMNLYDKMRNKSFFSIDKFGLTFSKTPRIQLNTRSFSFYLSDTRTQLPHLGNQNNDIITSLEMSKYGYVNMLQYCLPQYDSVDTQALKGGNTDLYKKLGTLDKGKVLVQSQPDASKISVLYSRVHHTVDFSKYAKRRLVGAVKPKE